MPDNDVTRAHQEFLDRARQIHDLEAAAALLAWDQETLLPPKGVAARARHKATLASLIHQRICAPELGELLTGLTGQAGPPAMAANLREMKRHRDRAVRIPARLVSELAQATSLAQAAWAEAKQRNDWHLFAPHLQKLVSLRREEAEAVGYRGEPYNALLDEYEPGARIEELIPLFDRLREGLRPLIDRIATISARAASGFLRQRFGVAEQDRFGRRVLRDIGYDFEAGRLDVSAHPFTQSIAIADVRITTRYEADDFRVGFFANLHEGGHALYEQGLPQEHEGTPVAAAVSLGIHESQSRLWENCVGRSREFWKHYLPKLQEQFPGQLEGVTTDQMFQAVNRVEPSLIRIEADEVTYNLHIILRVELERGLMRGDIQVEDLPRLWARKIQEDFGLQVPTDSEGALQDIHWAFGAIGYFPTYTLGNLYAAQFFAQAHSDLDDLPGGLARGEFGPLFGWLREKIHRPGCLHEAGDLCRRVTGRDLQLEPFLDYLNRKYSEIYSF